MCIPFTYDKELDILSLSTKMDYEESTAIAYDLMANLDTQGHCMGFELLDAPDFLLPYLRLDEFPKIELEEYLTIDYCADSETLSLCNSVPICNSVPVCYSETVIEHCIAHLDAEGDSVGFTLENAFQRILLLLLTNKGGRHKPSAGNG